MRSFLIGAVTVLALLAIGPLYIAGNTGSWRRGWEAAKSMLFVVGGLFAIGAFIGLLALVGGD